MLKVALCYIKQTSNGVDLNEIKQFIEAEGGKFIIVENGQPVMVVSSFEEYKKRTVNPKASPAKKETKPLPKELAEEELKIEDLPL